MKVLHMALFLISYFAFQPSSFAVDIDVKTKEWKKLDLPNRFPQTFIVSNYLSPIYFETGENSSELGEFLINLKKNKPVVDIDTDDAEKINSLINLVLQLVGKNTLEQHKSYMINVSVSKTFECEPCTEQKDYVSILNLNDFNIINVFLTN
jgi:hypothetical protein